MPKFPIFETYFKFMPQRKPKVCLSFIKNIIIQILITNNQETTCCNTTFGLSGAKICQILTKLIFFVVFFY